MVPADGFPYPDGDGKIRPHRFPDGRPGNLDAVEFHEPFPGRNGQEMGNGIQVHAPIHAGNRLFPAEIRQFQVRPEHLVGAPAVFFEFRQRDDVAAERLPVGRIHDALVVHEGVQDAHIGRSLTGIVLQVQQLEAAETRSAEAHLDIGLVQGGGPGSGGSVEVLGLLVKVGFHEPATEFHQVVRDERRVLIFVDFRIVRIGLELPGLVADDRDGNALERLGEGPHRSGMEMVQDTAVLRIAEGERAAYMRVISAIWLPASTTGGHEVHAFDRSLIAQEGVGTVRIEDMRGLGPEGIDQFPHHRLLSPQLVPQREQRKGRMVPIGFQDIQALFPEESQQLLPFQRSPERELRLEVDAQFVRRGESGLRRAPGMEADMVETVIFATLEVFDPGRFVHGRMPCPGEDAGVVFPPEEDLMPACHEPPVHDFQARHPSRRGWG